MKANLHSGSDSEWQFRVRHQNGQLRWLRARIVEFHNPAGKLVQRIGVATDITTIIEKEQLLEVALEKERTLTALQAQFITTASHEFRTPLTAISTSVELAQLYLNREPVTSSTTQISKHLAVIFSRVNSLNRLIGDTLMIQQVESGKQEVHWMLLDTVALSQVLIAADFGNRSDGRVVDLTVTGVVQPVLTDATMLTQVLRNLLSNAFKFSTGNPRLALHFLSVGVDLMVQDDGIGIPYEERPLLFGRFFRARNAGDFQGAGLGLAICWYYVNLLRGRLDVDSTEGIGTTMTIGLLFIPPDE